MLAVEVNREYGTVDSVIIKYFQPGHTFMSADSFHHKIEQSMCQKKRVEDFQDFQDIVDEKVIALPMHVHDFIDIPHGVSAGKFADSKPKMKDIMIFKFKRGSNLIYWKDSYQQEMFKVQIRKRM